MAFTTFGGPEVLEWTEVPEPPVGPDFVLVRATASAVNPVDWVIREGYLKDLTPHHFPVVSGWDLSGVVERVGPAITEFAPGDRVVGYVRRDDVQWGTYAELVSAPIRTLAKAPESIDLTTAAGLPLAGLTAWQSLKAVGVGAGDTVFINGASGGVGTFGVQLARNLGARVLGTAGETTSELVASLGGEPIRYGDGLVERVRAAAPEGVDAFLDFHGAGLDQAPQLVSDPKRIASIVDGATIAKLGGRYVFVRPNPEDLAELVRQIDDGKLQIVVDRVMPVQEAAEAQRIGQEGHLHGKLILSISA